MPKLKYAPKIPSIRIKIKSKPENGTHIKFNNIILTSMVMSKQLE